jgi:hypothetical protein
VIRLRVVHPTTDIQVISFHGIAINNSSSIVMRRKTSLFILFFLLLTIPAWAEDVYKPDKEGYIRDWLLAGPFPSEPEEAGPAGFARDFLTSIGGETKARPFVGLTMKGVIFKADVGKLIAQVGSTNAWGYTQDKTIAVKWKPLHWTDASPIIKLDGIHPDFRDHYVVYLACYVYCPEVNRGVQIRLGSDDDFRLWINGELIGEKSICRAPAPNSDQMIARLNQGWNRILLKICDRTASAAAVLQFLNGNGRPMDDVKLALELPEHKFKTLCKNIGRVDEVQGGCFVRLDAPDPCFVGPGEMSVWVGYERPIQDARILIKVQGPGGKEFLNRTLETPLKTDHAWEFHEKADLSKAGNYKLVCEVKDGHGAVLARFEKTFDAWGDKQLQERQRELTRLVQNREAEMRKKEALLRELESKVAARKAAVARQYETMERRYREIRDSWIRTYGPSAKSIDKPFSAENSPRESLCLNGDLWEIASAKSTEKNQVDDHFIPTDGWETVTVPTFGINSDHRYRFWPVIDDPAYANAPASRALDKKRAGGDYRIPEAREKNAMFLRTRFVLPEGWKNRRCILRGELAHFKVKVWLNGQLVWDRPCRWTKPLEIDLTSHAKPGENILQVFVGRESLSRETIWHEYIGPGAMWGLMGDVNLIDVPDVYVSDVWVIPNWRQAKLVTKSRIRITVLRQIVRDGRIKLEGPPQEIQLTPGKTTKIENELPWADPECWEVGNPALYHLVTTVMEDGKVIDRHFQRFGFREIWKSKFDLWLNGKRLFLQGDLLLRPNVSPSSSRHFLTLWFTILRETANINAIRLHFEWNQNEIATICDELGMLLMPQMYPYICADQDDPRNQTEKWPATHKENLRYYRGWVEWLRNHPSVILYSTDNEIVTQSNTDPAERDKRIAKDKLADRYEKYVKSLDPTRIVTRDGDVGTWGDKIGDWRPDPPSEVANYHYPEFEMRSRVINWQSIYEKPVIFGEVLYCAYGVWHGNIGAIPSQVQKRARDVHESIAVFRDLEIPGWFGMGIGHDGFVELKEGGTPFTMMPLTEQEKWGYIGPRLHWPAQSGPGRKEEFGNYPSKRYGMRSINWYIPGYPVYVLNAANRAYKECTHPMPPAPKTRAPEIVFQVLRNHKPVPGAIVRLSPADGQATERTGVRADLQARHGSSCRNREATT